MALTSITPQDSIDALKRKVAYLELQLTESAQESNKLRTAFSALRTAVAAHIESEDDCYYVTGCTIETQSHDRDCFMTDLLSAYRASKQ